MVSHDHLCIDCNKPIKLRLVRTMPVPPKHCYKCWRKANGLPPRIKKKQE
jgi:hypothetical protein